MVQFYALFHPTPVTESSQLMESFKFQEIASEKELHC